MPTKLTPIQKLDTVLNYLNENRLDDSQFYEIAPEIEKINNELNEDEVSLIIDKLCKDGYVSELKTAISTLDDYGEKETYYRIDYNITFEGALLIQKGGYASELSRIDKLEKNQVEMQKGLTYATYVLAIGTLCLVIIEVIKLFKG